MSKISSWSANISSLAPFSCTSGCSPRGMNMLIEPLICRERSPASAATYLSIPISLSSKAAKARFAWNLPAGFGAGDHHV